MGTTYTLISSNVLSSNTATVTFSSIPSTFTDLVLKMSTRDVSNNNTIAALNVSFNGSSSAVHSTTLIRANGTAASTTRTSSNTFHNIDYTNGSTSLADTFGSQEVYIPLYTSSQFKTISTTTSQENNTTAAYTTAIAGLSSDTAAITSITIATATTLASGSSFYLYGISNA